MNPDTVASFKTYFSQMSFDAYSDLDAIYSQDIVFKDPIHEIHGLDSLKAYFSRLDKNLIDGSFTFTREALAENTAYLSWDLRLELRRPKKTVVTSGFSVLEGEDRIVRQRDYFDAGELFYENVPLLGGLIRGLKRRLANQ